MAAGPLIKAGTSAPSDLRACVDVGVINALDTPARRALVPMLVPYEAAASGAALTGTVLPGLPDGSEC